jgi:hypothetical protein
MYISDVGTDRSRYSSDRDNLLSYKYLKEGFNAPEKMLLCSVGMRVLQYEQSDIRIQHVAYLTEFCSASCVHIYGEKVGLVHTVR